jgi:hypothetical protein
MSYRGAEDCRVSRVVATADCTGAGGEPKPAADRSAFCALAMEPDAAISSSATITPTSFGAAMRPGVLCPCRTDLDALLVVSFFIGKILRELILGIPGAMDTSPF